MRYSPTVLAPRTFAVHSLTAQGAASFKCHDVLNAAQHTRLSHLRSPSHFVAMNRPRNRQPRINNGKRHGNEHRSNQSRSSYPSNVPGVGEVTPGSKVFIVLKQDQSSGREVQGIVQDVLTSGNHPRGIKVRTTDGRVGRVQRMVTQSSHLEESAQGIVVASELSKPPHDQTELPSPRTLADFITTKPAAARQHGRGAQHMSTLARCPVCDQFEGDEIAVSRHIEMCLT